MAVKSKEEIIAEMDETADLAREEWDTLTTEEGFDHDALDKIASWLNKWVSKAGWKRLGRIIAGKD